VFGGDARLKRDGVKLDHRRAFQVADVLRMVFRLNRDDGGPFVGGRDLVHHLQTAPIDHHGHHDRQLEKQRAGSGMVSRCAGCASGSRASARQFASKAKERPRKDQGYAVQTRFAALFPPVGARPWPGANAHRNVFFRLLLTAAG
jgi:hypothetical protein